jgi:hypothetical protein
MLPLAQLLMNFQNFIKPECSLCCSQVISSGNYIQGINSVHVIPFHLSFIFDLNVILTPKFGSPW